MTTTLAMRISLFKCAQCACRYVHRFLTLFKVAPTHTHTRTNTHKHAQTRTRARREGGVCLWIPYWWGPSGRGSSAHARLQSTDTRTHTRKHTVFSRESGEKIIDGSLQIFVVRFQHCGCGLCTVKNRHKRRHKPPSQFAGSRVNLFSTECVLSMEYDLYRMCSV